MGGMQPGGKRGEKGWKNFFPLSIFSFSDLVCIKILLKENTFLSTLWNAKDIHDKISFEEKNKQ